METTATGGSGATEDPPTDSSGASDDPPEISNFTVNGTTAPAEATAGNYITLDVDAVDDVGIDRVEFYDDGQLIATATNSPFSVEVLISSADNGPHELWARAVDTADQEAVSEELDFSVNIIGGEMLETRDIAPVLTAFGFGPRISATNNELHIAASAPHPTIPNSWSLSYWHYNPELSLIQRIQSALDAELQLNAKTPPLRTEAGSVLIGGVSTASPDPTTALFTVHPERSSIEQENLGQPAPAYPTPILLSNTGTIIACPNLGAVVQYTDDLSETDWTNELGDNSNTLPLHLWVTQNDDLIVLYRSPECSPGSSYCIRRIRPDGSTAWTRPLTTMPFGIAESARGVAVATANSDIESAINLFDSGGNTTELWSAVDTNRKIIDLSFDPQGNLVVAGGVVDGKGLAGGTAWAIRLRPDGSELWEQTYEDIGPESAFSSIAINDNGRVFAVGTGELLLQGLFDYSAEGFVAELAL